MRAGHLLLAGKTLAEAEHAVGVARQPACAWKKLCDEGGIDALRSKLEREYLDPIGGDIQMTLLPPYSPELNPLEYLWVWLKRHALANFCPANRDALNTAARSRLKRAEHRPAIIAACWVQAGLG